MLYWQFPEKITGNIFEEISEIQKYVLENSKIETLKAQLKQEKEKSEEYYEHLKRNMAEFDNFKKRISKEKDMMYNAISADIVGQLLPTLDTFEKALAWSFFNCSKNCS